MGSKKNRVSMCADLNTLMDSVESMYEAGEICREDWYLLKTLWEDCSRCTAREIDECEQALLDAFADIVENQ